MSDEEDTKRPGREAFIQRVEARLLTAYQRQDGGYPPRDWLCAEIDVYKEDIARLRTLIKLVESNVEGECSFCRHDQGRLSRDADGSRHTSDCPAFTPDGEVK
ncbi:MAG TPA: hypothetical protein VFJ52_00495 [Terriglobia bacterium]|nr:hypothetical protein [Terriglobia bacterium]